MTTIIIGRFLKAGDWRDGSEAESTVALAEDLNLPLSIGKVTG